MSNLYFIKHSIETDLYIHYLVDTKEYITENSKVGAAVFIKQEGLEFLKTSGLEKEWILESTGYNTSDTEK